MCLYLISKSLIVTQQVFPKFLLDKRLSFFFLFFKENLFYSICPFAFFPFSHMYFQPQSTLLRALSLSITLLSFSSSFPTYVLTGPILTWSRMVKNFLFIFLKIFIVIQLQLYALSPHPSTPPQLNPPPSPPLPSPLVLSMCPLQQFL